MITKVHYIVYRRWFNETLRQKGWQVYWTTDSMSEAELMMEESPYAEYCYREFKVELPE